MSNIQYIQNYEPGVGLTLTPKANDVFLSDDPNDYDFYCCDDGKPFVACDSENVEYLVAVNKYVKFDHWRLFSLTNGRFMSFGCGKDLNIEFTKLDNSWRSINLKIKTKIIYSIE